MKKNGYRRSRSKNNRRRQRKTWLLTASAVIVILGIGLLWLWQMQKKQEQYHLTAENSVDVGSGYRDILYNGKHYRYNSRIRTILYAGIDSEGEIRQKYGFNRAPRSDSIAVAVLDEKQEKMTVIALNRDTITAVHQYNRDGIDLGTRETYLAYGYSSGEGGKVSIAALKEAVSNLLYGIPVNEYVITNRTSIPMINHIVDGVTVTIPNNDLADIDPEFVQGNIVTLDDQNVEQYLRYRDTNVDFSNSGRVQRQQSYITAYVEKLQKQLDTDLEEVWQKTEEIEDYAYTSITKNKYLDFAEILMKIEFTDSDFYRPEGKSVVGEEHDEFYVDYEALLEHIIEIFYEEI